jgi:hypothetical protein
MNKKFTILIGTCDKYSFLWNNFTTIFNRYWDSSIVVDKYFLSETTNTNIDGFNWFTPGNIAYSDCLKYALDNIKTPYVLWLQDDYFLRKMIFEEKFIEYMNFIENNNVDRFCFNRYKPHCNYYTLERTNTPFYKMNQYSNYTISMQSSIWNVNFFKSCLIENGKENPWEFEVNGSIRLNNSKTHNIYYELANDSWYLEGMKKGKFTNDYYDILQKEKLII